MYDVIIIGSGPAGLTAAVYTSRANLKTLVIAGSKWGGQLMLTTLVENYPGFENGIQGPDLMAAMRKQAQRLGVEFVDEDLDQTAFSKPPLTINLGNKTYRTKSVIIATGANTKWLNVPGERERIGRGVSTCAPCDAPFFRDKKVVVVGGGDSAMEEALVLTEFTDQVTIVHRRDMFRASQIMQDKVKSNSKIKTLFNTEILEVLGQDKVSSVKIKNNQTGEISEMAVDGVFVAIGHIPNSKVFQGIETDEKGFIKVYDHAKTNIEGVFVAGDVHDSFYKQAVTAAGFGCQAALDAERFLRS